MNSVSFCCLWLASFRGALGPWVAGGGGRTRRLAGALRLPFRDPLAKLGDAPGRQAAGCEHVMALHESVSKEFIEFGIGPLTRAMNHPFG